MVLVTIAVTTDINDEYYLRVQHSDRRFGDYHVVYNARKEIRFRNSRSK